MLDSSLDFINALIMKHMLHHILKCLMLYPNAVGFLCNPNYMSKRV